MAERYWVECAPGYVRLRNRRDLEGRMRSDWSFDGGDLGEIPSVNLDELGIEVPHRYSPDRSGFHGSDEPDPEPVYLDGFELPDDPLEEEYEYWSEIG